jgi:deoxyribodipyrimidine photolyase-like uncharacterized protein
VTTSVLLHALGFSGVAARTRPTNHGERLVVLGNLAMLAGVSPQELARVLGRY